MRLSAFSILHSTLCIALAAAVASADTKVWTGLGADAKASTAANWQADGGADPAAPVAGDAIVLDATGRDHPMTWDLDIPLASWTQDGYTNVVTISTVYPEAGKGNFTNFVVTGDVTLRSGTWVHLSNNTNNKEWYRLWATIGGDLEVGADAAVSGDDRGLRNGDSKGSPVVSGGATGRAHGGRAYHQYGTLTRCYGSIREPIYCGRSGDGSQGIGGGAIRLDVGGAATIDGRVSADALKYKSDGTLWTYWPAAGGSVWITAESISGAATGRITADAGYAKNTYAGGGGRVSLCLTGAGEDFSGLLGIVQAGPAKQNGTTPFGTPGTVYYETAADGFGRGRLVVDAQNSTIDRSLYTTDLYFADQVPGFNPRVIEVRNKGRLAIMDAGTLSPTGLVFSATGDIALQADATLDLSGASATGDGTSCGIQLQHACTFIPPADLLLDGCGIAISTTGVDFRSPETLALTNGAFLTTAAPLSLSTRETTVAASTLTASAPLSLAGNMRLLSGGVVTHSANTHEGLSKLDLSVGGVLTIDVGGKIDAYEKGFPGKCGTGSGTTDYTGSAHGGRGVNNSGVTGAGVCYGSLTRPTELGSGTPGGSNSRPGGGALKVTVAGAVTNNGAISANGSAYNIYAASSGGSVWLTAASLAGDGIISANAYGDKPRNNADSTHNRSGGGRVAVWLTDQAANFSDFTGTISAWGSGNTTYVGGAGTVYLKTGAQATDGGMLVIENRYAASKAVGYTEIGSEVTDAAVGRVEIKGNAKLRVLDGQSLTVNGDFVNEGVFSAEGGTLVLGGTGPAAVSGNAIAVGGLACTAPGKTVTFEDGFAVSVNSVLNLAGADGSPVTLRASEGVTPWTLTLAAGAEQSVGFVAVSDSDASGGEEIVAVNSTGADTTNWRFISARPGDVLTWTGASSSGWAMPANWDAGRAPIPTDVIVVPGGTPNQPELATDATVAQLTVASGAVLRLGGNDLTVADDLAVNGVIVASGAETIAVAGDCTLAANGFTPAESTLRLEGGAAQTAALGGNRLNRLVLANTSSGGISFTQDFTAGHASCAATGATALRFANGVTATVSSDLALAGASAEAPLTLAPLAAGGSWNLRSLGLASISRCAVSGSTATGNALVATDSVDNGGNVNWSFGTLSTRTWTGAVSADFAVAGNWAEGSVPGAGDAVVFDSVRPMTVSSAASVRSLVVGGTGSGTLTVNAPLNVAETLVAKSTAVIVANRKVTVGGSLIAEAGASITHDANGGAATANRIDIEVGGDLVLPDGASISAKGKGYAGSDTTNGGPGYQGSSGGSHGGRGGSHNGNGQKACYGSIYCPTNFGSARNTGIIGGGGAVRLVVVGELALDGAIDADGGDNDGSTGSTFYGSAGGSVWITAARLSGHGKITASGGFLKDNYAGAGGRVALYLTEDAALSFGGSVEAFAGKKYSDVPPFPKGAPGTIYIQTAADKPRKGRVVVANAANGVSNGGQNSKPLVDYPVATWAGKDDGRWATWELSNYATLNVTADAKIADVWLEGSKPQIQLNGHTLYIRSLRHELGVDDSQVVPGGTTENPGKIVWLTPPTVLMLR